MKKLILIMASIVLVLGLAGTTIAAPLLYDNFNSENFGIGALNYNSFTNWTVEKGTVDLIGNGFYDFQPGYGLYLDMDGSTGSAGKLTTKNSLSLEEGQIYILQFDLAGNQINTATESVTVSVAMGAIFQETFSLSMNDPFTTFTRTFTSASDQDVFISFYASGGDNIGMLLDNVSVDVASAPVPEPATMLLLASGLAGLAGLRRKFRK